MSDDDQPLVKRQKTTMFGLPSPATPGLMLTAMPTVVNAASSDESTTLDVCGEGDIVLMVDTVGGSTTPIGIRVSSQVLSITSPVFKRMFQTSNEATGGVNGTACRSDNAKVVRLPDDDGDTIFLLMNVLHLRNDSLPARIESNALSHFAAMVTKYDCVNAAGRAASTWFDHIYAKCSNPPLFQMVEAAYLLNDAVWFARFTSRFVLNERLGQEASKLASHPERYDLANAVLARQRQAKADLKCDLDLLVEPCAEALASNTQHLMGCAPDDDKTDFDVEQRPEGCYVDKEGGTECLVNLRDDNLWPSTRWSNILRTTVDAIAVHIPPDLNRIDECYFCIDVEEKFAAALQLVRAMHKDRLWGLCLDCYKHNGLYIGECRYDHFKISTVAAATYRPANGN
ncbi:uncharacterized protein MYCGRDRAFT_90453 [Zymoseptoria tritici IPO323]|uniref:BTB domain-containing protein n=1 Tax=Zymoseptoria tritici (strain CBS 115943 / IPO323) TaxID=336722 RepID=F9X3G8_ZYMTI|nr:uncharacterized protein MYCGRDRAFT_90453 [Zymoseptoria tritici IPO323]EGP89751.1 hypothetical protein MYCGRDRAFT_90453 [Zymoseptoria tritici IPO323]